jgi:endonuclease III
VVVTCVLLNQTTGTQVRPVLPELFRRWPTPRAMAAAGPELEELIRPLGLWRRRAETLRKLGRAWPRRLPDRAGLLGLPGVGEYAADAVDLLVRRDLALEPADKELKRWARWERHRVRLQAFRKQACTSAA